MLSSTQVDPVSHVPPHARVPNSPHVGGGPVQPHVPVPLSTTHVCPLKHTPLPGQTAAPAVHMGRVVVVLVVGQVVVTGKVVLVAPQQKPTAAGSSCTSFGLHTSRIFTPELKVPSLRGLAHRTAARAACTATSAAAASASATSRRRLRAAIVP